MRKEEMAGVFQRALDNCQFKGAILSNDKKYRYVLWRLWRFQPKFCCFIGLNPSTADAQFDDATIIKCTKYAGRWGFDGLVMINLFAYRATKPKDMMAYPDPVGPWNNDAIKMVLEHPACGLVVCAWGVNGVHQGRTIFFDDLLEKHTEFKCLGVTKMNEPVHPLYQPDDAKLLNYNKYLYSSR